MLKNQLTTKRKRCSRCRKSRSRSNFHRNRSSSDGLYCYCKPCTGEIQKNRYDRELEEDLEKVRGRQRDSHKRNYPRHKFTSKLKKYRITKEQYDELLDRFDGCCWSCGHQPKNRDLCIDHDHQTGKVRGLLCNHCNRALGLLGDSAEKLELLLTYIKKKAIK